MKIEIDLNNIFRDEDGNPDETLEESIRRQVTDKLSGDLRKRLFDRMDVELSKIMRDQISAVMTEKMPSLIDDILNVTYVPISQYGQRADPTTFRDEIIKSIAANMTYAPKNYSSDENAFTRAVKSVVEKQTSALQTALLAQIDAKFKDDAIKFAVSELSKRLGLVKP